MQVFCGYSTSAFLQWNGNFLENDLKCIIIKKTEVSPSFNLLVLNQEQFYLPGDIWQCLETLLVVPSGKIVLLDLVGGGQDCCQTSCNIQDSLLQQTVGSRPKCQYCWSWQILHWAVKTLSSSIDMEGDNFITEIFKLLIWFIRKTTFYFFIFIFCIVKK